MKAVKRQSASQRQHSRTSPKRTLPTRTVKRSVHSVTKKTNKRHATVSLLSSSSPSSISYTQQTSINTPTALYSTSTLHKSSQYKISSSSLSVSTQQTRYNTLKTLISSSSSPLSIMTVPSAHFATFKKVGKIETKAVTKEEIIADNDKYKASNKKQRVPTLNDLMRQLYKKIHPDLMMNYPEQKEQNEKSLTTFQGFLSGLKDPNGDEKYPILKDAGLIFFLRTSTPGHFQRVELLLHTDATLNRKGIEKQLVTFFNSVGIGDKFKWDDEYFPLKTPPGLNKSKEQEQREHEQAEYADNNGSYDSHSGGSNENYDDFMQRLKREADSKNKKQSM